MRIAEFLLPSQTMDERIEYLGHSAKERAALKS
jgi:hypothetical protein